MDPLPLIANRLDKHKHDDFHVLRQCFQRILTNPVLPENILSNAKKFNVTNKALKDSVDNIEKISKLKEMADTDISSVELQQMANHAFLINKIHFTENDPMKKGIAKLTIPLYDPDIPEDIRLKYGLIQMKEFDQSNIAKALDFGYHQKIECEKPTKEVNNLQRAVVLERESVMYKSLSQRRKQYISMPKSEKLFTAIPDKIIFFNYGINRSYRKSFYLTNVTTKSRAFFIEKLPRSSFFTIENTSTASRLAPGMSATFEVVFKTDTLLDMQDRIIFNTYTGYSVEVKLICYRNAPCLRTYIFKTLQHIMVKPMPTSSSSRYDVYRSLALNSVIDCGSCLLGNEIEVTLIMKNEGSRGHFFIVTEYEWFNSEITNISKNLELSLDNFYIHPSYFKVESKEFVEVTIQFCPTNAGLHMEYLYLLCDNNTFEKIDLIGDAINLNSDMVDMQGNPSPHGFSHHDDLSEYFLYFGPFLPFHTQIKHLVVNNLCCLDLRFRWEVRESSTENCNSVLNMMVPTWIEITNNKVCLTSYSETIFDVAITCKTLDPGLHSAVLMLVIEDVPVVSLEDDVMFTVYEKESLEEGKSKTVDVILREIELMVHLFPYSIEIVPEPYTYPDVMTYKSEIEDRIRIEVGGLLPVNCKWEIPTTCSDFIKLDPLSFILEPCLPFHCKLILSAINYKDIKMNITLAVQEGIYKKVLMIEAKVEKPKVIFSTHNLYFGIVPRGTLLKGELIVQSESHEEIDWLIMEVRYDVNKQSFYQVNTQCRIDLTNGNMNTFGQVQKITYRVNTLKDICWCSFLILISTHETWTAMSSICIVNYQVLTPKVQIHAVGSEFPVMCANELLFKNITMHRKILLQNYSDITACFLWGKPVGKQADSMNIRVVPKTGVLQPGKGAYIDVYLTPKKLGIFEDMYVPCFVGRTNFPLMLRVLCAVEDIYVNFYMPQENHWFEIVFWPPQIAEEFEEEYPGFHEDFREVEGGTLEDEEDKFRGGINKLESEEKLEGAEKLSRSKLRAEDNFEETENNKDIPLGTEASVLEYKDIKERVDSQLESKKYKKVETTKNTKFNKIKYKQFEIKYTNMQYEERCTCKRVSTYECHCLEESEELKGRSKTPMSHKIRRYLIKSSLEKRLANNEEGKGKDINEEIYEDVYSQLSFQTEKSDSFRSYRRDDLRNYISRNIRYLDQVMECSKVPIKTPTKRSFYIENLTPAKGTVTVESSNFYGVDINRKKKIMGSVFSNLCIKQYSEWEDAMNDDGILVKAIPTTKILNGHQIIKIDIWIYANTWGVYLDEISVDINEIMPFSFNLLVEVVGNPIEFPIAKNTVLTEPLFRFGTVSYKSDPSTRQIKVFNVSQIPVYIVWHIFVCKNEESDSQSQPEGDFNVLFDLIKSDPDLAEPSLDGKFFFTKEYYGKKDTKLFQLGQIETYLDKKTSSYVNITFDAFQFDATFSKREIEAYLIGFIYLSNENRYQSELLRRPTGLEIEPAKIKILANVELPLLELDYSLDHLTVETDAYAVEKERIFIVTKKIVFTNKSNCETYVSMDSEDPFEVIDLQTMESCLDSNKEIVKEGQNLEVTITCRIDASNVTELSYFVYKQRECCVYGDVDTTNYKVVVRRSLNIKQCGIIEHSIPLQLIIYYPWFIARPTNLDFGLIFVGCSGKRTIVLINKSAHDIPFFTCLDQVLEDTIICKPNKGILSSRSSTEVHVYFMPKEMKTYQETIRILSFLTAYFLDIVLQGIGTSNEKFYISSL